MLFSFRFVNFRLTASTIINLYKMFIRSYIEHRNSAIDCLNISSVVKLKQLQVNVPPFAINIQKGIKNEIIKKSGNITSTLGRKWLKKAVSNNPDIA